jgi:hypothetical protein
MGPKCCLCTSHPHCISCGFRELEFDDIQSDGEACLFLLTCLVVWGFVPNKPGIFKRAGSESSKSRDQKSKHM